MASFSVFASDSVPSDTSTKVDDDLWSAIDALTSLYVPVKSSFETYQDAGDVQEQYSWSRQNGEARNQFFSDELNPSRCPVKEQKARRNPHNSVIMSQMHSE